MNNRFLMGLALLTILNLAMAEEPIDQAKTQIQKIDKRVEALEKGAKQSQEATLELKKQLGELAANGKVQQQKLNEVGTKLSALEGKQVALGGSLDQLSRDTDQKTQTIDETITTRSKWYGGAIAALLALLAGCYLYLRRRNDASEQTLSAQVKSAMDTVRSTEEKIAKSDTALADSLFEILNKLKVQEMSAAANGQTKSVEPDHHLPLKLADEIHRMRKRLTSLPEDTKGLTPLQKSLERLESELAEQGYEIVDHTGMAYTENLSVKARFVPSDDLELDQKIISKVVVPQVNYKGVMIRMADIEVSIGS
jgi:chromosome segregation ATPase